MLAVAFLALLMAEEVKGGGSNDSTQIILAIIGVVGTISAGIISYFTIKASHASSTGAEDAKKAAVTAKNEAQVASQEAKDFASALDAKNAVIEALRQEVAVHKEQIAYLSETLRGIKEDNVREREEFRQRIEECQVAAEAASKLQREFMKHIEHESGA